MCRLSVSVFYTDRLRKFLNDPLYEEYILSRHYFIIPQTQEIYFESYEIYSKDIRKWYSDNGVLDKLDEEALHDLYLMEKEKFCNSRGISN